MNGKTLIETKGLTKEFKVGSSNWGKSKAVVHAVTDVNLSIYEGETLALVGESGCGKSTLGRLILNLIEPTAGTVAFEGKVMQEMKPEEMRQLRRKMQLIFRIRMHRLIPAGRSAILWRNRWIPIKCIKRKPKRRSV